MLASIDLREAGDYTETDVPILKQLVAYLQQRLARCIAFLCSEYCKLCSEQLPANCMLLRAYASVW